MRGLICNGNRPVCAYATLRLAYWKQSKTAGFVVNLRLTRPTIPRGGLPPTPFKTQFPKLFEIISKSVLTFQNYSAIIHRHLREWRNRQTRTFEGRVGQLVRVQVPSLAPNQKNPNQVFLIGKGFGFFVYNRYHKSNNIVSQITDFHFSKNFKN